MPATLTPPTSSPSRALAPRGVAVASVRSSLAGDEEFHVIDNVPVFPEHQTKAKDGRWLVFDYANLKAVCDCCNRRILLTGDYAAITLGHTIDPALVRAGKGKNPQLVGFAGPFRMGLLGSEPGQQKWCILARFRIFKDDWSEVRKYPRRSPELWLMPTYDQMFLDPIALLGAETPRLDMGLLYSATAHAPVVAPSIGRVLYAASLHATVEAASGGAAALVEKYTAAAPATASVFVPSDKYQGESPMDADQIVQSVVEALDSLDWVQWVKAKMLQDTSPAAQGTAPAPDVSGPPAIPDPAAAMAMGGAAPPPVGDSPVVQPPATPALPTAPGPDAGAAGPTPPAPPAAPPPGPPPPATDSAAPGQPPVEARSDAEPDKNNMAGGVPRVRYSADGDKPDKPGSGEAPAGALVDDDDDDDDDDDLVPEPNESAEQYRARNRDHRRRRRRVVVHYGAELRDVMRTVVGEALAPIAGQVQSLAANATADRVEVKNIGRRARLEGLARQGFAIDPDEMLGRLKYSANGDSVSDAEFERSIELLMKTGNRAPIDAPLLPIPDSIEQYTALPGDSKAATEDQRAATVALCERAAQDGKSPDYVGTLRNVVGGKNEVALLRR